MLEFIGDLDFSHLHSIEFWRTVTILFAAVGQTLFVLLYLTFPWWRNFLGRALFGKAIVFATLVDVAIIGRIFDWPKEDELIVVLYGLLGCAIWWQDGAFLRVRLQGRHDQVSGNPTAVARERERHEDETPPTHKAVER